MSGIGFNIGMGLGNMAAPNAYDDLVLPQADKIVRAYSLRRNVVAYKNGNGIKELRSSGGTETDVPFLNNGFLSITGADAFANVLYDQKGNNGTSLSPLSELRQATFENCPKVFDDQTGMTKGLNFDSSGTMAMAAASPADTALEAAITDVTTGFTVSFWINVSSANANFYIKRRSTVCGYLHFLMSTGGMNVTLRESTPNKLIGAVSLNTWTHIVLTVKTANGAIPYVQGVAKTAFAVPATPNTSGAQKLTLTPPPSEQTSSINDIMFWNCELSAVEVGALYAAQAPYYAGGAK